MKDTARAREEGSKTENLPFAGLLPKCLQLAMDQVEDRNFISAFHVDGRDPATEAVWWSGTFPSVSAANLIVSGIASIESSTLIEDAGIVRSNLIHCAPNPQWEHSVPITN